MVHGDAWAEVGAMDLVVSAWVHRKDWAEACSVGLALESPKAEAEVLAAGSPTGLLLWAWAAPKRWAVAGPKASLIPAWAAEEACSKDPAVASSMARADEQACSKDPAVASSMVRVAEQAFPKDPASMVRVA